MHSARIQPYTIIASLWLVMILACGPAADRNKKPDTTALARPQAPTQRPTATKGHIRPEGKRLKTRIMPPTGYKRTHDTAGSFAAYLRNLPLKPHGAKVAYYNGSTKPNNGVYVAVVDLPIGNKDLHQCADAIMRLRAGYWWQRQEWQRIHFNFTNGFRVDYTEWMKGKRVAVNGNQTRWVQQAQPANTYKTFWQYMEQIFMYAGTYSLSQEMKAVALQSLSIGHVFIQGGFPGHAVIVADMAVHTETADTLFLLAQSFMPAQDIQILSNPNNAKVSPWYSKNFGPQLHTPEWNFKPTDLKRF